MSIHGLTSDSKQHHKQGNRMPIHGLISDSKQTTQTRKQNANTWTYIRLPTKQTLTSEHQRKRFSANHNKAIKYPKIHKLIGRPELDPNSCHANTHKTNTTKKGCPERSRSISCIRISSGMRIRVT
jgi:hypothetical protein